MCKINYILYKHISGKYASVPHFARASGISQRELSAVLLQENIVKNIADGVKICRLLNLDINRLIAYGELAEPGGSNRGVAAEEFRARYMRLSEVEKAQVLELMDKM